MMPVCDRLTDHWGDGRLMTPICYINAYVIQL